MVKRTTSARHGTCDVVNNQVLYTPEDGYEGWDHCSYRVCLDGGVICDEALVEIRVWPASILPPDQLESNPKIPKKATPPPAGETEYVASNDFSKGAETLKLTQTRGAEHGTCVLTSDNQVQYIPDEEFLGTDHCGYITCINFVCDEGILAIKVTSLKTENRPTRRQSSSGGFVSNYESSGGLSLTSTKERPISEANYKEKYDGGRNLRGSGRGRFANGNIGQ